MLNQLSTPARRLHPMRSAERFASLGIAGSRLAVVGMGQAAAVAVDRRVIVGPRPVGLEPTGCTGSPPVNSVTRPLSWNGLLVRGADGQTNAGILAAAGRVSPAQHDPEFKAV